MADLEQIKAALVKADAAGDVEGARKLAAAYRSMSQPAPAVETAAPDNAPTPEKPKKLSLPPKETNPVRETVRSVLRGGTLGLSDVAGAGIAAGVGSAAQALGLIPDSEAQLAESLGKTPESAYASVKNQIGTERDEFRDTNPALAYGGEVAGAVIPAILSGGTSLGLSGAKTAGLTATALKGAGMGATQGAVYGAAQAEAGKEMEGAKEGAVIGGIAGGVLPVAGAAVKRVISPNASRNAELAMLKEKGVQPTIGQALGGIANDIEQKLTSVPFAGKKIADQRYQAREQFNNGILNEVLKPIGMNVKGAGFEAIKEAGNKVSKFYDQELSKIDAVRFDDAFFNQMDELKGMATGMNEQSARQFERILNNSIGPRMSEAGAMLPETYKKVQSELTKASADVSDKQLSDALKQAGQLLKDQMYRSNPEVAASLKNADTAYAMLVRAEDAAKRAVNADGVFTPAQLNAAIKAGDSSTRKRSVARGEALLQDQARIGQKILANTEPDSGTAGRMAAGAGLLSSGGVAGLVSGAASLPALATAAGGVTALRGLYSQPVQNALVNLVSKRGAGAQKAAEAVNALLQQSGGALARTNAGSQ